MQWSTPGGPGPRPDQRTSTSRFQRSNPGDSRRQLGIHSAEFLVCQQYPHAKTIELGRQLTYDTTTSWSWRSRKQKPVLFTKPCSKFHFVASDEIFCLDGCPKERGTRSDRTSSQPWSTGGFNHGRPCPDTHSSIFRYVSPPSRPMAQLTVDLDGDGSNDGSDTEELLDAQLVLSSSTPTKKRKRPSSPEPVRSKRSTAGKKKARLYD